MSLRRYLSRFLLASTATALVSTAVPVRAPAAPAPPAFDTRPAAQALDRLVGPAARQVELGTLTGGKDRFTVSARHGRLAIAGTTPAVLLTGFGWYLRNVAHADISLDGEQARLPARLPLPAAPVTRAANVTHRFALNDTNEGYAGAYLSWDAWQHRIDVLALHGINEVLVYEGQEAAYERAFEKFGYSAADMRGWIPQPAHQPWWLLQNISGVGSPISQRLIHRHAALGRRIADRLRDLGMTPVLPGYYGTVPPGFAERNPGAVTVPQGTWDGLPRPDWLDPTNPYFDKVAAAFYAAQTDLFGESTMYKMDLLHEGGTAGDVDVPDASRAVQDALEAAHPGAIWAILGWQHNPLPETLGAVDKSKMLVLDGISESPSITDRDADFQGTPYAFGTIWNFGGHTNLGASLADWNRKYHEWLAKPDTAMDGIALMPEAIDNNPAAVAFFTDMAWEDRPVDLHAWFARYATARYGAADPHALAAWRILADTVYSWPPEVDSKHPMSLFTTQPSLTATATAIPYDPADVDAALGELLKVDPRLRGSTAYRYDLVDLARQVSANHTRTMLPAIDAAYRDADLATFQRLTGRWLDQMALLDRLLGTDDKFLFGAWQRDAEAAAGNPAEAAKLRYDVRSLVTGWADGTHLQDYARREWNGLVGDYYAGRWRMLFDTLTTALKTGQPPKEIDWTAVAQKWEHASTSYPSRPHGSAYRYATGIARYPAGDVALTTPRRGVAPGGSATVTATFTNRNLLTGTGRLRAALDAPDGYAVRATTPTTGHRVDAGGTFTAAWTVTAPDGAQAGTVPELTATVRWRSGHVADTATDTTSLLVTGDVSDPYRTATNSDATFAAHGDTFGIAGGGSDLWKDHNEYGTIYRPGALTDGQAATTRVTRDEAVSGYARAGLIASADLGTFGSAGYASVAVTPGYGCRFSVDSDGNGTLDRYTEVDGFSTVGLGQHVHVRLSRDGDTFTGACSSDGTNWTVVGAAEAPGAVAAEDVGLVFSAVNAHDGQQGLATFDGLDLAPYTARDTSGDTVRSLRQPVTVSDEEPGHPATAAYDGSRANDPYWGGPLTGEGAWWQVDLGGQTSVSSINVRNYVDGKRYYTYQLLGSADGTHWYVLGGRTGTAPVTDAGDTFHTEATARYIKILGFSNSANATFHLTEVSAYGTPT